MKRPPLIAGDRCHYCGALACHHDQPAGPSRPPLIGCGQGRTPASLRRDAANLRWLLLIAVGLIALFLTRQDGGRP